MKRSAITALAGAALAFLGAAGHAFPVEPYKRAEIFAVCSGRLAALATRLEAEGDPAAVEARGLAADFSVLLEASMPAALEAGVPENQPERWRASGWGEAAHLLALADYSFNARRAERANAALAARLAECRSLILGGTS
ncbi:hypothetical protein DRV85_02955 [Rhodosalinus halophilus]|uniref:Uncharacterized protein n=1 Tax=Rhodosalinus halophilus TaxID=2259333 RepID=A0A365UCF4_9RHOB|nr:hypothetical protein [Rhodosalinus halophilus]RBI87100.1 hypothetical protein DRV85_02955 [Rhodosalinus halophilus]